MAVTTIFEERVLSGFSVIDPYGYVFMEEPPSFSLVTGETYTMSWDGVSYSVMAYDATIPGVGDFVALGNGTALGYQGNGEPFALAVSKNRAIFFAFTDPSASHTAAIRQGEQEEEEDVDGGAPYLIRGGTLKAIADAIRAASGSTAPIAPADMPAGIAGICAGGGGSAADVRYVTFMSHDGAVTYGKKAVALGDDCADPLVRGLFSTPVRESTARYEYAFAGWAAAAEGAADAGALLAVSADRIVYAAYTETVRSYAIRYFDGDTLLATLSVPYGTVPAYTPERKVGYTFMGWEPAETAVTGNADYYGTWIEKLDFNTLTWAEISAYCAAGRAPALFDLGAVKTCTYTIASGTYDVRAEIVGFDHDDLADGTGKAAITLRLTGYLPSMQVWSGGGTSDRYLATWGECSVRGSLRSLDNSTTYGLPTDLRAVMKTVRKTYYDIPNGVYAQAEDRAFLPSLTELGFEVADRVEGSCYEAFTAGKTPSLQSADVVWRDIAGTASRYWTRTKFNSSGYVYTVSEKGVVSTLMQDIATSCYATAFVCIG